MESASARLIDRTAGGAAGMSRVSSSSNRRNALRIFREPDCSVINGRVRKDHGDLGIWVVSNDSRKSIITEHHARHVNALLNRLRNSKLSPVLIVALPSKSKKA